MGILSTIIIMSLVIFISITYRKRLKRLKTQLTHVHYSNHHVSTCQSGSSHHFDNPVYATCSVTNSRLHNSIVKNVNIGRERSSTLPPARRVLSHVSGADTAEDDESSESSEKGECVPSQQYDSHHNQL